MRAIFAAFAVSLGLVAMPVYAEDATPAPEAPGSAYEALEQVPLTEAQVQHYVDSLADMQAAMGDAPADAAEPDAKTMAKLESIARKHGFKDFNEYNTVAGNIALVLDGVDHDSKSYIGADKLLQRSIDDVKADKQMTAEDKKAALDDLQAQLKAVMPIKYKDNIALVVKNYDKLNGD